MWLYIALLCTVAQAQNPYGLSQLDLYFRLLRSQNLGGFGGLANAARQIQTAEAQQVLSGLPPLPMTHEEVISVLTTEAPTTTPKPTAKPTTALPTIDPIAANNMPEIPPVPEDRIGGTFDEDGNFIADRKRNVVRAAKNYQLSDSTSSQRIAYQGQFQQPSQRVVRQPQPQQQPNNFFYRPQFPPQQAPPPPPPPQPQYPPLIFRAKPQPTNRDQYLNNLLLEIEEYDDFLDQVNQYRSRYPGAQVPNPYRVLPEGKLPALRNFKS